MNGILPASPASNFVLLRRSITISTPRNQVSAASQLRSGFTIIETLVVLLILSILIALVLGLAGRVTTGGKFSASKNVVQAMDSMANEYSNYKNGQTPGWVKTRLTQVTTGIPGQANLDDVIDTSAEYLFPLVDGRYEMRMIQPAPSATPGDVRFHPTFDPSQPTAALFLLGAGESPEVKRAMERLDAKFMQKRDVWAYGWRVDPSTEQPTGMPVRRRLRIAVPTDAFGFDIRMVHPEFQGGAGRYFVPNAAGVWTPDATRTGLQVRPFVDAASGAAQPSAALFTRSFRPFDPDPQTNAQLSGNEIGDADEGSCVGSRVYFYSVGADGDPGTRSDNVYTTQPGFPAQTAKVN